MFEKGRMNMDEKNVIIGYWYLPDNPTRRLGGELKLLPGESGLLKIFGTLHNRITGHHPVRYSTIFGDNTDVGPVTLSRCRSRSGPILPDEPNQFEVIECLFILIGSHIINIETIPLHRMELEYSCLPQWHPESLSNIHVQKDGYSVDLKNTEIDIARASNINIQYKLYHSVNYSMFSTKSHRQSCICITPSSPTLLEDFRKYMLSISAFLSIITGRNMSPTKVYVATDGIDNHFVYRLHGFHKANLSDEIQKHPTRFIDFMVKITEWTDIYFDAFSKWIDHADIMFPISLLIVSGSDNKAYLDNRFINWVTCIESFHQRIHTNCKYSSDEIDILRAHMRKITPTEYQEHIGRFISIINQYSLRERLTIIMKYVGTKDNIIVREFIGDSKQFISDVVYLRNYYTHFHPSKKSYHISHVSRLLTQLMVITISCIFTWIGIDANSIYRMLMSLDDYKFDSKHYRDLFKFPPIDIN